MPAGRSRVDLYSAIRRDVRAGMSNRALQRKHDVGYRTVAAAQASAWPEPRKPQPKRGSRIDPHRGVIDSWLRDDLDAPRKQRHTAKRIFDRLLDEHDAHEVSYGMVRDYVATRRREIRIEAGREPAATFIPQEHLPGREAEVDFGDVAIQQVHDAWWAAACKAHGDADGTRALIEVLMLHRHLPHEQVVAGLATALRAGALTADAVALEARKHEDTADDAALDHPTAHVGSEAYGEGEAPAVRSLTERRLRAHLPADTRPLPSVDKYDQLLPNRRENPNEGAAP